MKKLLILVGSENQRPLFERAKRLGIHTILCDSRIDVPCSTIANEQWFIDTWDVEGIVRKASEEKIDGIITNSEPRFVDLAVIAKRLGLRCLSPEQTTLYKNKFLMREFCVSKGLLSPRFKHCMSYKEAEEFFVLVNKKCIIKPLDNSASRGVFSINSLDELKEHFDESMNASLSEPPSVLMEEYITGTEFTIDSLKTEKSNYSLAISEKKHYAYNENVANQLLFDNFNEKFDYQELRKVNDCLVNATEIPFGLTHAEYKFCEGKYYLIEIQARGGGNFIATDIVPYISGIDSYLEQIKWCLGIPTTVTFDYSHLSTKCSVLYFFDVPGNGGVVKEIKGIDYLESLKAQSKLRYHLAFKEGDTIEKTKDDSTRIGWYILYACSREELDSLMKKIEETVSFILE